MQEHLKNSKNVLTFPVPSPFDMVYRNSYTDSPVGPHSHDAVELYFTLSDLPDVLLNDTVSAVPAGTLIIIPPFCVHQLYHEAGTVYERYILSINMQWLDEVFCHKNDTFSYLRKSASPIFLTPDHANHQKWVQKLDRLLAFSSSTAPETLSCFFDLLSIINNMINEISPKTNRQPPISATQQRINEIISYIQEHIYENLTVSDLATYFFLHPDYLSRLFKKHAHISVSRYITLQKTATAQSLLREGYTVAQVQEKLGYSSYAYFFKTFQKNTGLSPSKYREQYLGQ
ncbi:MAG: helix-turn-helix transcriptional regulator [Lachnospiraceae bacterium]|nr:helix-turn-helix transcriptional regulator [Lachnospiraceae bacterium]